MRATSRSDNKHAPDYFVANSVTAETLSTCGYSLLRDIGSRYKLPSVILHFEAVQR